MKTFAIRAAHGIRNDTDKTRFSRDEYGKVATYVDLSDSVNCDLDETGLIARRLGTQQLAATPTHSLWSDYEGNTCYAVINGVLSWIDKDLVPHAATSVTGRRLSYAMPHDIVYASDGFQNLQLVGASAVPWGIAVPGTPVVAAAAGDLRAGKYLVSMTYVRSTGEESGAPVAVGITVPDHSGLQLSLIPVSTDPLVTMRNIYVSDCNGEVLYLAATLTNSGSTAYIGALPNQSVFLRTQFFGPLPPGQIVGYHAGRLYVASETYLWYSAPYEYGLCDLRSGFIPFTDRVQTFASVSDGIFVGTTSETFWLSGTDPTEFRMEKRAAFGTVLGTERVIRPDVVLGGDAAGATACWMGTKGLCFGFSGGTMKNTTGGLYLPPAATEGSGLFKVRGGTPQYVTTLFA